PRKHLSPSAPVEGWNYTFDAAPVGAIPTELFETDHRLHLNNTSIMLEYFPPAHTDSDISITFADVDIIHVGDTWWNGFYPFIDYSTGGSIDGMIRATETNLSAITDKTMIIPGHGAVSDKAHLAEYRDMLVAIRENVAKLKKQ